MPLVWAACVAACITASVAGAPGAADPYAGQSCAVAGCHEDRQRDGQVHAGLAASDCGTCHVPAGAGHAFVPPVPVPDLCFQCHEVRGFRRYRHGRGVSCTGCHDPHVAGARPFLKQATPGLCLTCHADQARELEAGGMLHPPFEDDCLNCHAPHNAEQKQLLVEPLVDLCLGCHDDAIDPEQGLLHPVFESSRQCVECHSPHVARAAPMLQDEIERVCARCHSRRIERPSGPPVSAISERIRRGRSRHEPAADGDCTICHDPHGTTGFANLTGEASAGLYFPAEQHGNALCFDCHDEELMDASAAAETGFRDGDRNLHALHLASEGGRRRSCRLCHDPHASGREHLLRRDVAYGDWRLPVGWQATASGGRCAPGCHEDRSYSR